MCVRKSEKHPLDAAEDDVSGLDANGAASLEAVQAERLKVIFENQKATLRQPCFQAEVQGKNHAKSRGWNSTIGRPSAETIIKLHHPAKQEPEESLSLPTLLENSGVARAKKRVRLRSERTKNRTFCV